MRGERREVSAEWTCWPMGEQKTHTKGAKVRGGHEGSSDLNHKRHRISPVRITFRYLCDLL
jgi:hypothetical protein